MSSKHKHEQERKFENWDQFLDPELSNEKSHREIIDEMFSPVPAPMEYKQYVDSMSDRVVRNIQIVDHIALIKEPNGDTPYFDIDFIKKKLFGDDLSNDDRTAE